MIKKLILLAAGAVMMIACEKVVPVPDGDGREEQEEEKEKEKEEERETVENLSASGTANCYVIGRGGCYSFDAKVRGNGVAVEGVVTAFGGDAGGNGRLAKAIAAHGARLIWQSCSMVSDVALVEGVVQFQITDGAYGNALIGVEDENGTILWSWHIWYPEQTPVAIGKQGFMNLNLGAIRADAGVTGGEGGEGRAGVIGGVGRAGVSGGSRVASREDLPLTYGMMYQWGRKDPLPGSPVVTGDTSTQPCEVYGPDGGVVKIGYVYTSDAQSIEYSIAHPFTCISHMGNAGKSQDWLAPDQANDGLWGEGNVKTCFDPCPAGWMVPGPEVFKDFSTSGTNYTTDMSHFNVADLDGDGEITAADYAGGWYFIVDDLAQCSDGSLNSGTSRNLGSLTGADGPRASFFPAAARYDAQYAMLMGSMTGYWGNYWTAGADKSGTAIALGFSSKNMALRDDWSVTPQSSGSRAYAFSVRCVAER